MYSFSLNCLTLTITFRVHVDNKLHGKIYIASKNDNPLRGIITSANFTDRGGGVKHNHEWGVQIDESAPLKQIIADITKVSSHALTHDELQGEGRSALCNLEQIKSGCQMNLFSTLLVLLKAVSKSSLFFIVYTPRLHILTFV
ncbi:restriction endonuclease PLD domain-containing protein [Paenibacillus sp. NPDC055715]